MALRFESVDDIVTCDYSIESVDEILKCEYTNESYWAVPVYCAVQSGSRFLVCG